jgi:5-methylcytosine-specific restriction endonuclease McrA
MSVIKNRVKLTYDLADRLIKNKDPETYLLADSFSKETISAKMEQHGNKCAITGIPHTDGGLAADHFVPKEKGGKSVASNCVILNKILNEKKNNMMPVEWFCKTLMTNFVTVSTEAGLSKEDVKRDLIAFLQQM